MIHASHNPETYNTTTETGQAGQAVVRPGSARYDSGVQAAPCSAETACADADTNPLQRVAAGILGGVCPREFRAGIDAGNRHMGNRAFLHWVGGLQGRDRDPHTNELAAGGFGRSRQALTLPTRMHEGRGNVAALQVPADGPLQLMPKRKKKVARSASEVPPEASGTVSPGADVETLPVFGAAVSEAAVTIPHADPAVTATPGQKKKKKKSRVQVALNTLREEGVGALKSYIEAEISEAELLRTLTERISRAQDLGDNKEAARRVVEARLRVLDPESVPVIAQAAEPGPGQSKAGPDIVPVKSELSIRERELFDACIFGDVGKLRRLLRHVNVDINIGSQYGTLLCYASYNGRPGIVRELLSRPGIDVNLATQEANTPLYFAAQDGYVEVVKLLLAAPGINVNLAEKSGSAPLSIAVEQRHVEVVGLLLAAPGINVNTKLLKSDATPLNIAAERGWEDIVRLLLDALDIDINARKADRATALFCAAQNNFPRIVEQLVRRGANANLALSKGTSPLCRVACDGYVEVVRVLLRAPAIEVDRATDDGTVPLSIATQEGHKDIVRLLLRKGADPNLKYETGITPLHLACLCGHTGIVEMLLHAGADMDAEAEDEGQRYTPYSLAQLAGQREVVSILAAYRQAKIVPALRVEALSPCLRPQEQALEDDPGSTQPSPQALSLPAATVGTREEQTVLPSPEEAKNQATGEMDAPEQATTQVSPVPTTPVRSAEAALGTEVSSPLAQARDGLRQEVLRKLEQDTLGSLEGIRLLEDVNAAADLDRLCNLYNRLAGIERQRERARRRGRRREVMFMAPAPAQAGAPLFALGGREGLDAEAVDAAVKRYLEQRYHRFVGQAVNDMEFGRGRPTSGYRGLWHASAGVAGVGSCSVFYYTDAEQSLIRIVGIGHHVGRAAYQLDYSADELGVRKRILHIA